MFDFRKSTKIVAQKLLGKDVNHLSDIIESDQILLAIILQNAHHDKNSLRVEAISAGSYVEFSTAERAN